jgi:hypothetical protein
MFKLIYSILCLSLTTYAQEGGVKLPMGFESTATLPSGIRNLNYRNALFQGVEKYEDSNQVVPVGNALNKDVTWNKLLESKDDLTERATIKGLLDSAGIDLNASVGETTGIVELNIDVKIPIFAYGLSSNWTMAMAIPVVESELYVDNGFVAKEALGTFANDHLRARSVNKTFELQQKTLDAINEKLRKNNYNELPTRKIKTTRLGDLILVSKYKLLKEKEYNLTLKNSLTIPTGETTDVNEAVDIGSGDGQWDMGVGLALDYKILPKLTFALFNGIEVQLPDTSEKRIPEKGDSKITPDIDDKTKMDLGDKWMTQASLNFEFLNGFNIVSGYTFQYKAPDNYDGDKYPGYRYDWLERDTEQRMGTVQAGIGYSTIPLFRQQKFKVPLNAKLFYTKVVNGKNVIKTDMTSFELSLFF